MVPWWFLGVQYTVLGPRPAIVQSLKEIYILDDFVNVRIFGDSCFSYNYFCFHKWYTLFERKKKLLNNQKISLFGQLFPTILQRSAFLLPLFHAVFVQCSTALYSAVQYSEYCMMCLCSSVAAGCHYWRPISQKLTAARDGRPVSIVCRVSLQCAVCSVQYEVCSV